MARSHAISVKELGQEVHLSAIIITSFACTPIKVTVSLCIATQELGEHTVS